MVEHGNELTPSPLTPCARWACGKAPLLDSGDRNVHHMSERSCPSRAPLLDWGNRDVHSRAPAQHAAAAASRHKRHAAGVRPPPDDPPTSNGAAHQLYLPAHCTTTACAAPPLLLPGVSLEPVDLACDGVIGVLGRCAASALQRICTPTFLAYLAAHRAAAAGAVPPLPRCSCATQGPIAANAQGSARGLTAFDGNPKAVAGAQRRCSHVCQLSAYMTIARKPRVPPQPARAASSCLYPYLGCSHGRSTSDQHAACMLRGNLMCQPTQHAICTAHFIPCAGSMTHNVRTTPRGRDVGQLSEHASCTSRHRAPPLYGLGRRLGRKLEE